MKLKIDDQQQLQQRAGDVSPGGKDEVIGQVLDLLHRYMDAHSCSLAHFGSQRPQCKRGFDIILLHGDPEALARVEAAIEQLKTERLAIAQRKLTTEVVQ